MSHHWGYVGVLTSAILFGISTTLNKIALENVNPMIIAGTIYLFGGILLLAIHYSPLHKKLLRLFETPTQTETTISKKDYKILALVIVCGSILAPLLLLYGLNETTASNTALLLNAECLFTVLIAFFFLRERGEKKDYFGIFLLFIGVIILTTNAQFQNLTLTEQFIGNLLIIGACFFWGIDNNLSKFLSKKRDIVFVTGLKCFIGGGVLLVISQILGISFSIPLVSIPYILTVGAFGIAFSILLFLFALREIGSMRTGIIFSSSSLFGALFALVVLKEPFSIIQLVAGVIMLIGIYVIYKR
jgi:drug/metabolite transporter (DMT)-like permease